jgi:hypothetical protein
MESVPAAKAPEATPTFELSDHVKLVLATLEVKTMAWLPEPEQSESVKGELLTSGVGFTVTTNVSGVPAQLFKVGVTMMFETMAAGPAFAGAGTAGMGPVPEDIPNVLLLATQLKLAPGGFEAKA